MLLSQQLMMILESQTIQKRAEVSCSLYGAHIGSATTKDDSFRGFDFPVSICFTGNREWRID